MKCFLYIFMILSGFIFSSPLYAQDISRINWVGCGVSKKAFINKIAIAFEKKSGIPLKIAGGGATKGIRVPSAGQSHVGGSCRPRLYVGHQVIPEEKNVTMLPVAWDALVFVVSRDNKVNNLTLEQIKGIFSGKINNWSQVGGDNAKIILLVRKGKISGVGYSFRTMVMKDKDFEFPDYAHKFKSTGPIERNLANKGKWKYAIGIDGISSAKKTRIKVLSLNGVYPSKQNIASGKYPLFRPLFLVVQNNPAPQTSSFVDYVLSEEGQKVISGEGTVNMQESANLMDKWETSFGKQF